MSARVGLVGYGLSGRVFHAPLIRARAGLDLAAVASGRPDAVRADLGPVDIEASPATLIARADLDLVVVSTPNDSHFDLAAAALAAGRHVVVEKPFTATSGDADALIARAAAAGRCLTVFHNRRWDGDFLTLRQLVDEGRVGDIVRFEVQWDRFRPLVRDRWREREGAAAGVFFDLGSHLVDQALRLMGQPDWVWGDVQVQRPGATVDDDFHLVLGFGRGRAILKSGCLVPAQGPRYQVHGTGGSFIKWGLDPQEEQLAAGMAPGDPGFGDEDAGAHGTLTRMDGDTPRRETVPTAPGRYLSFYEDLARALRTGSPPPVPAVEARDVIRIIELALESDREGRRVPV